jgi:hypothetical protein
MTKTYCDNCGDVLWGKDYPHRIGYPEDYKNVGSTGIYLRTTKDLCRHCAGYAVTNGELPPIAGRATETITP